MLLNCDRTRLCIQVQHHASPGQMLVGALTGDRAEDVADKGSRVTALSWSSRAEKPTGLIRGHDNFKLRKKYKEVISTQS